MAKRKKLSAKESLSLRKIQKKNLWDTVVAPGLQVGSKLESRKKGRFYTIVDFDDQGFRIERQDTGSTVRITRNLIETTAASLLAGETLKFQASRTKGGISYTVAQTSAVVWALGELIIQDDKARVYRGNSDF